MFHVPAFKSATAGSADTLSLPPGSYVLIDDKYENVLGNCPRDLCLWQRGRPLAGVDHAFDDRGRCFRCGEFR